MLSGRQSRAGVEGPDAVVQQPVDQAVRHQPVAQRGRVVTQDKEHLIWSVRVAAVPVTKV